MINSYSNETFRKSFSILMLKCEPHYGQKCKSDEEIQAFLKTVFFTFFTTYDDFAFTNSAEVQRQSKDKLIYQFQVDLDRYRDNNNYIRLNTVTSRNNRF